ncbi:hypothetical protein DPX16_5148 [Anabarilius grahami]|uniref:Uncharacterized protein n=1 Tax=Anabarilius grahami TaxID=495550 RepID=A0A3N0XL33_ANAGA|nr:hypothetical protein DPX16_5148 [Anabarilius grahami]
MKGSFVKRPPSRVDEMALQVHTRVLVQTNVNVRHVRYPNDAASITVRGLAGWQGGKRIGGETLDADSPSACHHGKIITQRCLCVPSLDFWKKGDVSGRDKEGKQNR